MAASDLIDALQSQLENLVPNNLRYAILDSQADLTVDTQNDIESLLQSVVDSVTKDKYDEFKKSFDSIIAKLYGDRITELAKFNRETYEQEVWEQRNPSDEENVAAASEYANSASIDKLDELVDAATGALDSVRKDIEAFLATAKDA
jgi:ABC-type transporter MlaC component